jgi:hypothetical protein
VPELALQVQVQQRGQATQVVAVMLLAHLVVAVERIRKPKSQSGLSVKSLTT